MRLPAFPNLAHLLFALVVLTMAIHSRAQPAAPVPAATTPPKTLFLIRGPDGIVTAIRAVSAQQQGAVLLIVNASGGRAMVQARTVVGQLPWFTDEEIEDGAVDPAQLAAKYEVFAGRLPAAQRKFLTAEAARFRAVQKRRDDEASAKQSAAEARIAAVTSATYEAASDYTVEALESLLQAADAVRGEDPAAADRIAQWETPFREHLAQLKAGSHYENGTWVTREEITRRAQAAREAAFLRNLDASKISALALPPAVAHGIATRTMAGAGFAALAGAGLIIGFRRRPLFRLAGVALLVGGPVTVAGLFFLATRNPGRLPSATAPGDLKPVVALLAEAAGFPGSAPAGAHSLSESAVNTFLAQHVRLEGSAPADKWAAVREALAVRLQSNRLSIFELLRCADRSWIVRYDLVLPKAGAPAPLAVSGVKIGALDCPPELARQLWSSLEPQLISVFATLHLSGRFTIQGVGDGTVQLVPPGSAPTPSSTPPPAASASPDSTPKSSPAPENLPIQSPAPNRSEGPTPSPAP